MEKPRAPRVGPAPFTLHELLDGLALVMPADLIAAYRRDLAESPPEPPGIPSVTDGMLLIMSAVSESNAARVLAHRPDLRARVEEVRADPAAFLRRAQMRPAEEDAQED